MLTISTVYQGTHAFLAQRRDTLHSNFKLSMMMLIALPMNCNLDSGMQLQDKSIF